MSRKTAQVRIHRDTDIVKARSIARELALRVGFAGSEPVLLATAVSEIARNIVEYARLGVITISTAQNGTRPGLVVVAQDAGPGIADVPKALHQGYTSGRGLGMGLPGVRRLMDEFEITSEVGHGTTVTMKKWLR